MLLLKSKVARVNISQKASFILIMIELYIILIFSYCKNINYYSFILLSK